MVDPKTTGQTPPAPANTADDTEDKEHEEDCLDEALEETFPASDPIAPQAPDKHTPK